MESETDPKLKRISVHFRMPRYSVRSLLIALTAVSIALGVYGWHLAEERRQLRLLDAALGWAAKDGSLQDAEINDSGEVVMLTLDGRRLQESTILALIQAEMVFAVHLANPTEPIRNALSEAFVQDTRSKLWLRSENVTPKSR